jgi:DNA (cytosine-5)-methyltransferase 1
MTFIDWFAGIGGFRRGMELAGHQCVGFCEFDKYAVASYTSMHLITDKQREYLATLPLRQRQKEILKEEYRNGEWFANDIRRVCAEDIPKADCWCFGFPCQDISVAGKQLGFTGNRSSLFFRVMYLVEHVPEEKKPVLLFAENVKNLLSVNGGWDFARLLTRMDEGGVRCRMAGCQF